MKKYIAPDINLTYFNNEDIVTISAVPGYTEGLKDLPEANLANINYNDVIGLVF